MTVFHSPLNFSKVRMTVCDIILSFLVYESWLIDQDDHHYMYSKYGLFLVVFTSKIEKRIIHNKAIFLQKTNKNLHRKRLLTLTRWKRYSSISIPYAWQSFCCCLASYELAVLLNFYCNGITLYQFSKYLYTLILCPEFPRHFPEIVLFVVK